MSSVPGSSDQHDPATLRTIRAPRSKDRPYFATARVTAQDANLSFEARGVLWYLLSKPDDWIIRASDVVTASGAKIVNGRERPRISRRKAESLLTELRRAGYLVTERERVAGRFVAKTDRLYEVAHHNVEKPQCGKTTVRKNDHIHIRDSVQSKDTTVAPAHADAAPPSKSLAAPRQRNALFDASALHLFGIQPGQKILNGARIGKVVTLLKAQSVAAEEVEAFVAWYRRRYPDTSPPRDPAKLEEHLLAWRTTQSHVDDDTARWLAKELK